MHSSTSNSEPPQWPETYWKRRIPEAHWLGVSLLTALLVLGFMVCWETWWRLDGYEPSYEETAELWARQRDRIGTGSADEVVYTGSSRIQFDFDLDVWEQDFGGPRPVCLARPGTNPRAFLKDIAAVEDFKGLLIVGITEGLFFTPDGIPPDLEAQKYLEHYKHRSISARTDFLLGVPLQCGFAALNKEDLTLSALLRQRWLRLPNRAGAQIDPEIPPYFNEIQPDRRFKMWHRCERDPQLQQRIQQIWLPLFQMGPPFGGPGLDALMASVKEDVDRIRARGGRVVFVRFPSTGGLWQLEQESWPREAYWERLLRETGAPGIHFEDDPSLRDFDCPEWSHLTRADAVTFTRNLIPLVRQQLAL